MPRSPVVFISAFAALAAAAGCAHEQKPETPRPPAARAPAPPPPRVVAAATPAADPTDAPKAKEEPAIYFDFDSSLLKDDGRRVLQTLADTVRGKRNASLEIEGNCDELGTTEYNLALGEERARAAKTYLVHLGVPAGKIATVSYGSQRPKYPGHDDDARAKNRRDDLRVR